VTRFVQVFPARMDALARVTDLVEKVGAAAAFERHDSLRLALVIEELFTNTVTHGHGGDSEAPVQIAFDVEPGRVALTYEDTGPPFDPFAPGGNAPDSLAADERLPGGLGLVLVARLASEGAYARVQGRNRISFVIRGSP
jgi:serine/threonine-protein kinase RsbW